VAPTKGRTLKHKPVERKRLTDLAHEAIRESITAGNVEMGQRLVETQLAEELGMSRAPIREALRRLAEEGLVVEHPHHGTSVATLTADDVADLYNVRLGLEVVGLRCFMRRSGPIGPLRDRIDRMAKAAARGDRAGVVRAEFEFHRHIAKESGNAVLAKLFSDLEGRLTMVMALDDESFEDLHEVAAEHEPIVEALEAGDERRAVDLFEEHLVSTVGLLLDRLNGDPHAVLRPIDAQQPT
jgi:DNA-binding GntR family transcriptional regulator